LLAFGPDIAEPELLHHASMSPLTARLTCDELMDSA
jgi:hypothetical protein